MKAIILKEYGRNSSFLPAEIPEPKLENDKVIIQVCASSVNPVDCKIRNGLLPGVAPNLPGVLHGDVSGIVREVGDEVKDFKVGDEVYGCIGGFSHMPGVLSEYALADSRLIAKKPVRLSMIESAALPLVSITAWNALVDRGRISPNQKVLIHAGTGGVGHLALQLAKAMGAETHVSISNVKKAEIARALGADDILHYSREKPGQFLQNLPQGCFYDLVLDTVGGCCLDQSFQAAREYGTVVSIAARASHDLTLMHMKSLSLHVVFMLLPLLQNQHREKHGQILQEIAAFVDQGKINPLIHPEVFSFENVGKAHQCWESSQAIGKIVLENNW